MEIKGGGYAIMDSNIQRVSHSQILLMAAVAVVLWAGGCADPFGEKSAALQSDKIIRDVSAVKTTPEPNISRPEIYKSPPKIVEQVVNGKSEWKLFYFCKYHTAEELKTIVNSQFSTQTFEKPDKPPLIVPNYTVSSNPATNQLIARCPGKADVDAVLEVIQAVDVPPIQIKIDCIISEVYADKTLDRETTIQINNLLGEDITLIPGGRPFGSDVADLVQESSVLPAFPGASLREVGRAKMGLKIGYLSVKNNFLALVDMLESKGYLKILMNPTLEVVNGKSAMVSSSQHVPLQQISTVYNVGTPYAETRTEYIDVIDSLKITPHVFADGIGLETDIILGSKLTPEGVKQMPIITKKEIENKENRIRPGESLVIGGIRKTERRDVVRGVPGLKDLPLLGTLFSGRDFEERAVETIFILTPTISTEGAPKTELAEEIERKHEPPTPPSGSDILGLDAREKDLQKKVSQAEKSRLQAEQEKAQARGAVRAAGERVQIAQAEAQKASAELVRVQAEAEKMKAAADKAAADAAAAKAAAEKIAADATKTKEESEKAKAEADAKAKAAEAAKAAADKAAAEAAGARAEAEKTAAQTLKTKADAEKTIADAEAKVPTEEKKTGN